MAKEKGMGKGLSALLGEDFSADFSTPSSTLSISQIESYQNQPRKNFDQEKLKELADSIRQHGLIQPPDGTKASLRLLSDHCRRTALAGGPNGGTGRGAGGYH